MKRRDILKGVLAGSISATILPWLIPDRFPKLVEREYHQLNEPNNGTCRHCGKETYFAMSTLIDTSAGSYHGNDRTYDIAGAIWFHTDGSRCYEERVEYKKLKVPKVHMNKRPQDYEERLAERSLG